MKSEFEDHQLLDEDEITPRPEGETSTSFMRVYAKKSSSHIYHFFFVISLFINILLGYWYLNHKDYPKDLRTNFGTSNSSPYHEDSLWFKISWAGLWSNGYCRKRICLGNWRWALGEIEIRCWRNFLRSQIRRVCGSAEGSRLSLGSFQRNLFHQRPSWSSLCREFFPISVSRFPNERNKFLTQRR